MQSGMTDADAGSDLALARALAEEVGRHGGQLKANFVPALRPDLRKRLGDEKLLQFVRRFPELLEVRDHHGGSFWRVLQSLGLDTMHRVAGA